jgi:3-deoxy-D-manno-octulosonic-acid transferase
MLASLGTVCAQTQRDADRFHALGATRIEVTGNLKFDRSVPAEQVRLGERMRELFGRDRRVFLAASTRDGEEALVLEALGHFTDRSTLTVIVPRHPQRFATVSSLLREAGVAFQRRSTNEPVAADTRVVLGDSMGEMFAYYAACDVAFIGGSLLPLGGQNLLEACAVGKPAIVGPHTFNFEEATEQAIAAGAALRINGVDDFATTVSRLLEDAAEAGKIGQAGLAFMARHRGATGRTISAIGL